LLLAAGAGAPGAFPAFGRDSGSTVGISGTVEWEALEIGAEIWLDLAAAGIRMPAGRIQAEAMLASEYLRLVRPRLMGLQVDSSATVADLIDGGYWSLAELEGVALEARRVPPSMSGGMDRMLTRYSLDMAALSAALIRHRIPADIPRTLAPVAAPAFSGILIIASDELAVRGRETPALLRPALFPRIWDGDMNLIFERNMLYPGTPTMVRYFPRSAVFAGGPTGLSPELAAVVGDRPLRVLARGAFGTTPTDPIISRDDALAIIGAQENRDLLRTGRVAVILDDSVLREGF